MKLIDKDTESYHNSLLWIDIETTGLYGKDDDGNYGEQYHRILEVAACITDYEHNVIMPLKNFVIHHEADDLKERMNEYVFEMHRSSGLLAEVDKSTLTVEDVKKELIDMVTLSKIPPEQIVMAGSSIHFDRFFLSTQMPEFNSSISHRNFDTSTIAIFYNAKYNKVIDCHDANHRASDDITRSIEMSKLYMSH